MSKWVRGIYNTAANFVMSGSLRAASGSSMGRNPKQLREESEQSDQSNKSYKSDDATNVRCNDNFRKSNDNFRKSNDNLHVDGCVCSICRDYNEYAANTSGIRTEGQGAGARIRVSNEPRSFKHTNSNATDAVEQSTGIPTGVTV